MLLYALCRIFDILSIAILVTDVIMLITQQETSTDIIASFVAVLWGAINSVQIGLGMLIAYIAILIWYSYRVWMLILTRASNREQSAIARPFSIALLGTCDNSSNQLTPIETEFLAKHTKRLYDDVRVTFSIGDLLALTNITCAGAWNISGLDDSPYAVTSTVGKRSDGITKWTISTNINYCGASTPEIAIPPVDRNLDNGSCLVHNSEHSYSVDLWDPNFASIADLRSTDSKMLVTIIWTFIYLYGNTAELYRRFTHFQVRSDYNNRLCFVLWGSYVSWYAVTQCRATIQDLLDGLYKHQTQSWHIDCKAETSADAL